MRWLVTGAWGQVGSRALRMLTEAGEEVTGIDRDELDITDAAAVSRFVGELSPDVLLNCAAYTAVDAAETDEASAAAVNVDGPRNLATALAAAGGRLVHISTDYVFDGTAAEPYEPGDATGPATAYGRTKLAGELAVAEVLPSAHHVVRTAWVYGGPGPNFVDTMIRLESERDTITVVDDQIGSPTYAEDLAGALISVGRLRPAPGTLHFTNTGIGSWCDLARAVFAGVGADPGRVHPVSSAEFVRPAPRPAWSVLSGASWTAAGLPAPRPWQEALTACLAARPAT